MLTVCALCAIMSLAVVVRKDKHEVTVTDLYADHLTQFARAEAPVGT